MSPTSGSEVKVFLVDDHDIVRQGLRDLLAPARDVRVVGDSGSAARAPSSILGLGAHVMVLDLHLQDGNGVQVCRQVRSADPTVQGLLLTSADDDEALAAAVLAGAAGFVVKLARSSNVLDAIRRIGSGARLIDDGLLARAAGLLRERAEALAPPLDDRQTQIFDQLLAGLTDTEIADALGLDPDLTRRDIEALTDQMLAPSSRGHR